MRFNGLLDRLHEALERQRRFTGDASHQLRTPLTGLLSQVDVALRLERPPGEYQRVLKVVRAKGATQTIIRACCSSPGRVGVGRRIAVMNLTDWLPDHLRGWSNHARAEDIQVRQDEEPLWVRAHPALLSQLLGQPAGERLKYSAPVRR